MSANELTDEQIDQLTDEQRQTLREQFIEVYSEAQDSFDSSVRTLAAAGIAVTVSLAAALKDMPTAGKWAVGLFVVSLTLNLASYATSQWDMKRRIRSLHEKRDDEIEGNVWTTITHILNIAAGLTFISGAVVLAVFVGRSA
jgi:hypothetical protein